MNKSRDQIKRKFKSFEKKDKKISDQIFRPLKNYKKNKELC